MKADPGTMRKSLIHFLFFFLPLLSYAQENQKTFTLYNGQLDSGSVMRRYDIFFDLGKATLRLDDSLVLDSLVDWLLLHPEFTIEVGVHTDRVSKASSTRLTTGRAKSIRDYFIAHAVPAGQVVAKGFEDTKNLISQDSIAKIKDLNEKVRLQNENRRIEFRIIKIDPKLMHLFTLQDTVFWPGEIYRSYKILFELGKVGLRPESLPYLDTMITFLEAHPQLKIEIGNHTDVRGSLAYNLQISKLRASFIASYFVRQGIDPSRITSQGYGESQLIIPEAEILKAPNKEAQEKMHSQNRRVEFKIISVQ